MSFNIIQFEMDMDVDNNNKTHSRDEIDESIDKILYGKNKNMYTPYDKCGFITKTMDFIDVYKFKCKRNIVMNPKMNKISCVEIVTILVTESQKKMNERLKLIIGIMFESIVSVIKKTNSIVSTNETVKYMKDTLIDIIRISFFSKKDREMSLYEIEKAILSNPHSYTTVLTAHVEKYCSHRKSDCVNNNNNKFELSDEKHMQLKLKLKKLSGSSIDDSSGSSCDSSYSEISDLSDWCLMLMLKYMRELVSEYNDELVIRETLVDKSDYGVWYNQSDVSIEIIRILSKVIDLFDVYKLNLEFSNIYSHIIKKNDYTVGIDIFEDPYIERGFMEHLIGEKETKFIYEKFNELVPVFPNHFKSLNDIFEYDSFESNSFYYTTPISLYHIITNKDTINIFCEYIKGYNNKYNSNTSLNILKERALRTVAERIASALPSSNRRKRVRFPDIFKIK
jgi:hypothetical protein